MAKRLTLDELEELVKTKTPVEIFTSDINKVEVKLKELRTACHPDLHPGDEDRAKQLFQTLGSMAEAALKPPVVVKSKTREYTLSKVLGVGDIADVHLATSQAKSYVFKVSRINGGHKFIEHEQHVIAELLTAAGDGWARHFLPTIAESYTIRDSIQKRVNVYLHVPHLHTLEAVRERYKDGVDDKHLIWMGKRIFSMLDFVHRQGWINGALTPAHLMVHSMNHGIMMLGWPHAVKHGEQIKIISAKYEKYYPPEVAAKKRALPATDIYMAVQCLIFVAGGDPNTGDVPDKIHPTLRRFFRRCLLEGQSMRPDDAGKLHDDLREIGKELFGPPKFHQLVLD